MSHGAPSPAEDRWILLGSGFARLPERLLLAHSRGEILFITGAGTSMPSGLPDFRGLVLQAYNVLDKASHAILSARPPKSGSVRPPTGLSEKQVAEIVRFDRGDYDVVLGMLERRIDGAPTAPGKVRETLAQLLRTVPSSVGVPAAPRPSETHRSLVKLAARGSAAAIATTNFDRLLQRASTPRLVTHALGSIPRPGRRSDFSGVLHIHGVLHSDPSQSSELVVTDRDFGELYLRRRLVPDFIYDAARLFNIVLVGYSANDAPMRYLLNAVAADGSRFDDLRERFAFVPQPEKHDLSLEDWQARGITPIPYERAHAHAQLSKTLKRWSDLSPINGSRRSLDALLRRLVVIARDDSSESDRDLFDHLVRRSAPVERRRMTTLVSVAKGHISWLEAASKVVRESDRRLAS